MRFCSAGRVAQNQEESPRRRGLAALTLHHAPAPRRKSRLQSQRGASPATAPSHIGPIPVPGTAPFPYLARRQPPAGGCQPRGARYPQIQEESDEESNAGHTSAMALPTDTVQERTFGPSYGGRVDVQGGSGATVSRASCPALLRQLPALIATAELAIAEWLPAGSRRKARAHPPLLLSYSRRRVAPERRRGHRSRRASAPIRCLNVGVLGTTVTVTDPNAVPPRPSLRTYPKTAVPVKPGCGW